MCECKQVNRRSYVSYREGTDALSVTYKRASELASDQGQAGSPLRADAVLVNPETKAHVRIHEQVSDSTTANVSVLVAVAVVELNKCNTKDRRDLQVSNSVRGTTSDVEEHVKQSKVNEVRP
jgi:hypothetical protein